MEAVGHVGRGCGLAVSTTLGVLVASDDVDNTLRVFSLPPGPAMDLVCTLGGAASSAPLRFAFNANEFYSGVLAFVGSSSPLLLVTDAGQGAVHMVNVAARTHAGFVAAPGTVVGPRGVAACAGGPDEDVLVAVSTWPGPGVGDHVVRLYQGATTTTGNWPSWTQVCVLGAGFGRPGSAPGQLDRPFGLRLASDGSELAVADAGNGRVLLFRVGRRRGTFVRLAAAGLGSPMDVEGCEGGWLVACHGSSAVRFAGGGLLGDRVLSTGRLGVAPLGFPGYGSGKLLSPIALALVPGLGLLVRDSAPDGARLSGGSGSGSGRVQVFAPPDVLAMCTMSPCRLGWMLSVYRACLLRAHGDQGGVPAAPPRKRRPGTQGGSSRRGGP